MSEERTVETKEGIPESKPRKQEFVLSTRLAKREPVRGGGGGGARGAGGRRDENIKPRTGRARKTNIIHNRLKENP